MSRKKTNLKKHNNRHRRQVMIGHDPATGKPIVEDRSFDTKTEADIWAENTRAALRNNTYVKDTDITVKEWAMKWLVGTHIDSPQTHATYSMYEQTIRLHISPLLGALKMKDLKVMDINTAMNAMFAKGLTRRIEVFQMTMNQICESAVWENIIGRNPVPRTKLPNIIRAPREPLSEKEIDTLLSCGLDEQESAFVCLGLFACLRRGEILGMKKLSIRDNEIHIKGIVTFSVNAPIWKAIPKTEGAYRSFKLPQTALTAVDALNKSHATKRIYLFSNPNGELLSETSFQALWLRIERKFNSASGGINPWNGRKPVQVARHITPHLLRHTGCTIMYYAGFTVLEAAYIMGHDDYNTTMAVYTHLDKSSLGQKKYQKYYPDYLEILGKRPQDATAAKSV